MVDSDGDRGPARKVADGGSALKDTEEEVTWLAPASESQVASGAKRKVSWRDVEGCGLETRKKMVSMANPRGGERRSTTKKARKIRENPGERPFDNVLSPVPVLVLKGIAEKKAGDNDQAWAHKVLRSSCFPEDHRSFAYLGSDEVRIMKDHVVLYGAHASLERWAQEELSALSGDQVLDPNNIRDRMLAVPQWERVVADIQDAGFSVLPGFFRTDDSEMIQSDASRYLEHFDDLFVDEQDPGPFREIINLGVKKDAGSIAGGMARFITPNDAVNEKLEKEHREVYKQKLRIEASVGMVAREMGAAGCY